LLCQYEIYDAFSVAAILMDNTTFLNAAIDLPVEKVLDPESPQAVAAYAMRGDAIRMLRANLARLHAITSQFYSSAKAAVAGRDPAALTGIHD